MNRPVDTRNAKQRTESQNSVNKINKLAQKLNNKMFETCRPQSVKNTIKGK